VENEQRAAEGVLSTFKTPTRALDFQRSKTTNKLLAFLLNFEQRVAYTN
jgi:hypothetical protein